VDIAQAYTGYSLSLCVSGLVKADDILPTEHMQEYPAQLSQKCQMLRIDGDYRPGNRDADFVGQALGFWFGERSAGNVYLSRQSNFMGYAEKVG